MSGYTPVTPMSQIETQYSWLFNSSVSEVPFELIILGYVLLLISYSDLQMNDSSDISLANSDMSEDTSVIDTQLSNAVGSVSINDDGTTSFNSSAFTEEDASELEQAYTSLYVSDPNSDYTWGQMNITWEGSTYYLWPNGQWSTEQFTGQSFKVDGVTVNQSGTLNADSGVSDAGLYMMTNGIYAVDMASYTGGSVHINITFTEDSNGYMTTTESMYKNNVDPVLTSLGDLYASFSVSVETSNGGNITMNQAILQDYSYGDEGNGSELWNVMTGQGGNDWGFIYDYGESLQTGGGSALNGAVDATNAALTAINNESTLLTNQIQELTQDISNYNSIAQTILQDASQANMNFVNNQKV